MASRPHSSNQQLNPIKSTNAWNILHIIPGVQGFSGPWLCSRGLAVLVLLAITCWGSTEAWESKMTDIGEEKQGQLCGLSGLMSAGMIRTPSQDIFTVRTYKLYSCELGSCQEIMDFLKILQYLKIILIFIVLMYYLIFSDTGWVIILASIHLKSETPVK